jgi:hypothetical protein
MRELACLRSSAEHQDPHHLIRWLIAR